MNSPATTQDEPSTLSQLQTLPRDVWIIFIGSFINRFGTFVIPFLMLHLTRQGYKPGTISMIMACYGAGHVMASVVGGWLADHFRRKNTIVLSTSVGAVIMVALAHADSIPAWISLLFLLGLTAEAYRPASSALITDLVPLESRTMAFAAYRFAINAGWAVGPAIGGLLAQKSYTWLLWGDAFTSALFCVLAWITLTPDHATPAEDSTPPSRSRNDRHFVSVWRIHVF